MLWFERLQKAIDYIEAHLLEDIHMEDIAKQVNFSPYEFHRAFSFMSGMTLNTYIRNRRLSLAGQELIGTDKKVIDIAMKYGFETQVGFTKAFTRFHGSTPKQAKKKGAKLHLFNPLVIKILLEGGSIMDYRMEHKESQQFIAMVRAFPNEIINDDDDQSVSDFWGECYEKDLIEPMKLLRTEGKRDLYGLCSPVKDSETHFNYGIGVLVDEDTDNTKLKQLIDNGYSMWKTEPADYAVFQCIGSDGDCLSETWSKFFKEFIPQTGYVQTDDTDYEIYFENGESGVFCELWVPVKKN